MKIAKIILAAAGVLTIVASAALAEQMLNGTITKVDRINNSLAIRQTQSGTVGANTGGAAEEFKTQDGLSLEKFFSNAFGNIFEAGVLFDPEFDLPANVASKVQAISGLSNLAIPQPSIEAFTPPRAGAFLRNAGHTFT